MDRIRHFFLVYLFILKNYYDKGVYSNRSYTKAISIFILLLLFHVSFIFILSDLYLLFPYIENSYLRYSIILCVVYLLYWVLKKVLDEDAVNSIHLSKPKIKIYSILIFFHCCFTVLFFIYLAIKNKA